MEIFRTDGGGKTFVDDRLFKLVNLVNENKKEGLDIFEKIKYLNDHKGDLRIVLHNDVDINNCGFDYIYSIFRIFWENFNEYNVTVYSNGIGLIGYGKNDKLC